jgi:hypothetical protein
MCETSDAAGADEIRGLDGTAGMDGLDGARNVAPDPRDVVSVAETRAEELPEDAGALPVLVSACVPDCEGRGGGSSRSGISNSGGCLRSRGSLIRRLSVPQRLAGEKDASGDGHRS